MDRNPPILIHDSEFAGLIESFNAWLLDIEKHFLFQTTRRENQVFISGVPLGGVRQIDEKAGMDSFTLWFKHQTFTFCKIADST